MLLADKHRLSQIFPGLLALPIQVSVVENRGNRIFWGGSELGNELISGHLRGIVVGG